jgi:protein-L-isoaspartate(D-aspartate) O-methyltransferase
MAHRTDDDDEAPMDYEAARRHMVESQVRANDVADRRIQGAMAATPREIFLPVELRDQAYVEREIQYAPGRRLLRARDLAKLLDAADPQPNDLALNALCGSGYCAAVLASLCEMVVALDNDEALAATAQENFAALGIANAAAIVGAPFEGAPDQGPYDLIVIAGAIERRPDKLLGQLKDGGRLAAVLRKDGVSRGGVYRRSGEALAFREAFDASTRFVLPGFERPKAFAF